MGCAYAQYQCSQPSRGLAGPCRRLPRALDGTGQLVVVRPVRLKGRTVSRSSRSWLYFLCYLGMLLFVLCFEILSVCTLRKDGVLYTPSFSKVVEVVI